MFKKKIETPLKTVIPLTISSICVYGKDIPAIYFKDKYYIDFDEVKLFIIKPTEMTPKSIILEKSGIVLR